MKKFSIFILAASVVSLTSCLKDNRVNLAPDASPPVIEWETATLIDLPLNATTAPFRSYYRGYTLTPTTTTVTMTTVVDITGTEAAPSDITVSVGINPAKYATYAAANQQPGTLIPAAAIKMPSTVTIAKGLRTANVDVVIDATQIPDFTRTYIIPLDISATSSFNPSGNYGCVMYYVNFKNKFDGVYTIASTMTDTKGTTTVPFVAGSTPPSGVGTITAKTGTKYYLETVNATTVAMYDYSLSVVVPGNNTTTLANTTTTTATPNFGHEYTVTVPLASLPITVPATTAAAVLSRSYGVSDTFAPTFTFDYTTGVITSVSNFYTGSANTAGSTVALDLTGTNKFTTGTAAGAGNVFGVSYIMSQPAAANRVSFKETFTYSTSRPNNN